MPVYRIDLHVHSPSSNCFFGTSDSNSRIVYQALNSNLNIIAITDHHSIKGVKNMQALAKNKSLEVLPGVELSCRVGDVDEVFILAVFDNVFPLKKIEEFLLSCDIPEDAFGSGSFVIKTPIEKIINGLHLNNAMVISSRSDKTPYRQKAIPELLRLGINIFDLVYKESVRTVFEKYKDITKKTLHFFTFSDAHSSDAVGSRFSELELESPSFKSLIEKLG
ncbi:MAG: PHP domain-containing protein [Elusimicrobia bacterium]|nr:PHP domain-containing protein [Candidatus Liberimonas magnetica]